MEVWEEGACARALARGLVAKGKISARPLEGLVAVVELVIGFKTS